MGSGQLSMYCIVLYCIVLYCIVLYCIVLYCIVLYCIVLYYIVLYCFIILDRHSCRKSKEKRKSHVLELLSQTACER